MTQGVLYQLMSADVAEILVVSLASLREHWSGPVTIAATNQCEDIANEIATDRRLALDNTTVAKTKILNRIPKPFYTAKTWGMLLSPYVATLALDVDTLIQADPSVLFGRSDSTPYIGATSFCNLLERKGISKVAQYQMSVAARHSPAWKVLHRVARQRNDFVTNTGVLAYSKDHLFMWNMHNITMSNKGDARLTDGTAFFLSLAQFPPGTVTWYPAVIWNCSVRYATDVDLLNAGIIHGHSNRWRTMTRGRKLWGPRIDDAFDRDYGGITQWGRRDIINIRPPLKTGLPRPKTADSEVIRIRD